MKDALHCPWCGAPTPPAASCGSCSGRLIVCDAYRLIAAAREPAGSRRYLAVHVYTREEVAVDIVSLSSTTPGLGWAGFERIERTASLLSALQHAALPKLCAFDQDGEGWAILVCERIAGGTLEHRLREGVLPDDAQVRKLEQGLRELAAFLHARDIVHGAIEPSNIAFRTAHDWSPVLLAFGAVGPEAVPAQDLAAIDATVRTASVRRRSRAKRRVVMAAAVLGAVGIFMGARGLTKAPRVPPRVESLANGACRVETNPPGAEVFAIDRTVDPNDDEPETRHAQLGVTPIDVARPTTTARTLLVRKHGFRPLLVEVSAQKGQCDLAMKLSPP